jgi:hypothetical protein
MRHSPRSPEEKPEEKKKKDTTPSSKPKIGPKFMVTKYDPSKLTVIQSELEAPS